MTMQRELEESHGNAYAIDNDSVKSGNELLKRTEVEETPFVVIETPTEAFGIMGKYRITDAFAKTEDVIEYIKKDDWKLRLAVMGAIIETYNKEFKI